MVLDDLGIDLAEFRDLFLDESQRHLQTLNEGFLRLEQYPEDEAALANVFRAAHTLKGMAATMGYDSITQVSHAMEDILDQARVRPESLAPLISLLFDSVDTIELLVSDVAAGGSANLDITAAIEALHAAQFPVPFRADARRDGPVGRLPADANDVSALSGFTTPEAPVPIRAFDDFDVEQAPRFSPLNTAPDNAAGLDPTGRQKATADSADLPPPPSELSVAERFRASRMVHLDVQHLDHLLDIVTEMVIHRGPLASVQEQSDPTSLKEALAFERSVQSRLLDQLQDAVLKTRLVPISQVFDRFPRMVRDLLKAQGKDAQLVVEGAQVELDRTTLASVGDSLVHLLRNAVDHGMELPAEREAARKPRRGTIRLAAHTERGAVVIEVSDDGRGIDVRRIADVAVRRGAATREDLADMNEAQILELICSPGFSSNTEVTTVSGRGVGMDAVKRQIELMRGTLTIATLLGRGTVFQLWLPVNLALLDALLITVADEWYAVPASHVERILQVNPNTLTFLGDRVLMNLPEGVLPLKQASTYLGTPASTAVSSHALVMRRHNRPFAVGVDRVIGYEQIVAKPLPPVLEAISCLSGVTILGGGKLAFIVDLVQS